MDAGFDNRGQFLYSLQNKKPILDKGSYIVIVDAVWNNSAHFNPLYKQVLIDLYGPEPYELEELPQADAMKVLERGLKAAALKIPFAKRSYYRQNDPEYGQNLFRVSGINDSKGFYSYVYRGN